MGTSNREPQEYSRNIMEYKDPSRYIPLIVLLSSWGSLFGVPSEVPVLYRCLYRTMLQPSNACLRTSGDVPQRATGR